MAIVRRESRNRIGIIWFDSEQEATDFAARLSEEYGQDTIIDANIGFAQCGRDPVFDRKDENGKSIEFAVVTP